MDKAELSHNEQTQQKWDLVIQPKGKWYDLRLRNVLRYKDLLWLFVRRDFVAVYKQTILGPVWFFVQPVITALTFTVIFGGLAGISTDGIPGILFYLSGITLWTYFSDSLTKISDTFTTNASVFGKVYFPRIIVPLSVIFSNLIKLSVQFLLFLVVWIYFLTTSDKIYPRFELMPLLPLLILIMGFMGLAFGIIITSLTTKYRDLKFLVSFGVQLLMYASPIVYPLSVVPEKYKMILLLNPLTGVIETFKCAFLGSGVFSWVNLSYSIFCTIILLFIGLFLFNRVEKSFTDTV
ncbi:MAG: Membrane protein of an transporter complex [Bacteroidetes bacterium]|jgi:lipopolysaccharide transport system permease protein|nr:Membrane protein of an transporter complex [Bacteroidota bacterium]